MIRLQASVPLLLVVAVSAARAVAPPAQPRDLTAREQKEVAVLQARLDRHATAGQFAEAARLAEQIASFRAHRQGARHWQAIDERFRVATWQQLAKVAPTNRPAVVAARALQMQGSALIDQ